MRSTTFALLGVTAAMGLGLVAIVSQQGWPALPNLPLPAPASEQGRVDGAIAVPQPASQAQAEARNRLPVAVADPEAGADDRPSRLAGSRQLATAPPPPPADPAEGVPAGQAAPPAAPDPAGEPPVAQPAVQPAPQPATPPAAASPSTPAPSVVASATNRGKGHAYGKQKPAAAAKGQSRPEALAPAPPPATKKSVAEEAAPPPEVPSSGHPGKGNGHAYGRAGK